MSMVAINCDNCGAPLSLMSAGEYFSCEYCTALHFYKESRDGLRMVGKASTLPCSLCAQPLVQSVVHGEEVLACARCQGILLPQRTLGMLIQKYQISLRVKPKLPASIPGERQRRVACPQCQEGMECHPYYGSGGDVLMDSCARCRLVWLDRNELARILNR